MTVLEHDGLATAADLVDGGVAACLAHGREDLARRLADTRQALAETAVHVLVVGDFKQGKSSLVNALVGTEVCPVDDNVATAVPTYVRHGDPLGAELVRHDGGRQAVDALDLPRHVLEGAQTKVASVEVRVPSAALAGGLVVVDTAGVGGLGSVHGAASLAALPAADAALFVTDAEDQLTRKDLDFLRRAVELCPTVVCVLTKTDFYPGWRTVRSADEQALAGLPVPIVPVSVPLRLRAAATGNAELDEESGFAGLARLLADDVLARSAARLVATAADQVAAVCEQLAAPLDAERQALAGTAVAAVEPSTAWQQALTEGFTRLGTELDADLRARVERVVDEANEAIEAGDPADTWPQMTSWLLARMSHEMIERYVLLRERVAGLGDRVAGAFRDGVAGSTGGVDNPIALLSRTSVEKLTGRGMMRVREQPRFGMLDGLTAVELDRLDIGIALVMGQQGVREEKEREQIRRRTQAKNAVRRYCDQVGFVMGKDSRAALGRFEDELGERYRVLAGELGRTASLALAAANPGPGDREARLAEVASALATLEQLRARALAVPR
jgi:hypothetical protein